MDKPVVRISVRNLVEFILRSGDLDNRGGSSDREAMQKGSRLHRKIQGRMGSHYRAEVSLKYKTEYEDVGIQVEGRAEESSQKMDSVGSMRSRVFMQMSVSWRSLWRFTVHRQCVMPGSTHRNRKQRRSECR